jgi:hypothetical protein
MLDEEQPTLALETCYEGDDLRHAWPEREPYPVVRLDALQATQSSLQPHEPANRYPTRPGLTSDTSRSLNPLLRRTTSP